MQFRIEKTRPDELDEVFKVYAHARRFMAEHDNPLQWGNSRPTAEEIEKDIADGKSYVCMYGDQIVAVFYYNVGEDPTYRVIEQGNWLNNEPYGVVHRIASAGIVRGAGSYCLNWALEQCGNLKIDTHSDNIIMQNCLKKNGFTYCGIIYLEDGDERLAFQKTKT